MNIWDIALLIVLALFIYKGARSGFVRIIGGFAGIIIGAWAAGQFYDTVAQKLIEYFDFQIMTAIVIAFIAVFVVVNIVVGVMVNIVTKIFRFIPFATLTNRIIGALLGFLEGLLLLGLVIWVINLFPFNTKFTTGLKESRVAKYFEYSTKLVQPLLPKSLREIDFGLLDSLNEFGSERAEYLRNTMPTIFKGMEVMQEEKQRELDAVNEVSQPSAEP